MSNSALVTDAAKQAARQTLADFSAGVFAHISGDWSGHNQARIYSQPYLDSAGHTSGLATLRLGLTFGLDDVALVLPLTTASAAVVAGSPPAITVQPADLAVTPGSTAGFAVAAISNVAISYQWRKNGVNISGQTASGLVLLGAQSSTDAGTYSVLVTNVNGSTASREAILVVSTAAVPGGTDSGVLGTLIDPPGSSPGPAPSRFTPKHFDS